MNLKRVNGLLESVKAEMSEAEPGQFLRTPRDAAKISQRYDKAHRQYMAAWRSMIDAIAEMQFAAGDANERDLVLTIKSYRKDIEKLGQHLFPDRIG